MEDFKVLFNSLIKHPGSLVWIQAEKQEDFFIFIKGLLRSYREQHIHLNLDEGLELEALFHSPRFNIYSPFVTTYGRLLKNFNLSKISSIDQRLEVLIENMPLQESLVLVLDDPCLEIPQIFKSLKFQELLDARRCLIVVHSRFNPPDHFMLLHYSNFAGKLSSHTNATYLLRPIKQSLALNPTLFSGYIL